MRELACPFRVVTRVPAIADIWTWTAWGLSGLAATVTLAVLIGRRAKGPHCPKCGYSLEAATDTTPTCPECGRISRGGRDLMRRHRRWALMRYAACLFIFAYAASVVTRTQTRGWIRGGAYAGAGVLRAAHSYLGWRGCVSEGRDYSIQQAMRVTKITH